MILKCKKGNLYWILVKRFVTMRLVKHWSRLLRKIVKPISLGALKSRLNKHLRNKVDAEMIQL